MELVFFTKINKMDEFSETDENGYGVITGRGGPLGRRLE